MLIKNDEIEIETDEGICIYDISSKVEDFLRSTAITIGQLSVTVRHTTAALTVNENEERLLEDFKVLLNKLVPASGRYMHNDLYLRDVTIHEPKNAQSHLLSMIFRTTEMIPVVNADLAISNSQSVFLIELDGPRTRTLFLQVMGE